MLLEQNVLFQHPAESWFSLHQFSEVIDLFQCSLFASLHFIPMRLLQIVLRSDKARFTLPNIQLDISWMWHRIRSCLTQLIAPLEFSLPTPLVLGGGFKKLLLLRQALSLYCLRVP